MLRILNFNIRGKKESSGNKTKKINYFNRLFLYSRTGRLQKFVRFPLCNTLKAIRIPISWLLEPG
jgi:hypothetical protein